MSAALSDVRFAAKITPMTAQELRARIDLYERLMRLNKPIGTLLLLWPTLWAVWIAAGGEPHWAVVGVFTLGTLLMRSAGTKNPASTSTWYSDWCS